MSSEVAGNWHSLCHDFKGCTGLDWTWYRSAQEKGMRTWFGLVLLTVFPLLIEGLAAAQQSGTIPRVGFIVHGSPDSQVLKSFQQGLRELGYIEGQNITVEARFDYGNSWRLDVLVTELVQLRVNVIVVDSSLALFNVMSRTKTIPVVMRYVGDPVAAGIVSSLERPGGNVTGIGGMAAGLGGKWLELLKETVPTISTVGVLYTRPSEQESPMMKELEVAARPLRIELQTAATVSPPSAGLLPNSWGPNVGGAFKWATRGQ